ncbi:MAG: hypothetical protein IPO91_31985 [Chloroflexi bacterium]|nr:hypothetical protein [Chloroflexota bacterium]
MDKWDVTYAEIVAAIKHGRQPPGTNKRCYRNLTVAVVREFGTYVIVTVWLN